jgi:hypothetical protein
MTSSIPRAGCPGWFNPLPPQHLHRVHLRRPPGGPANPLAVKSELPKIAPPYDALPEQEQQWHTWARSLLPAFSGCDWDDIRADLVEVHKSRGDVTHPFGVPTIVVTAGISSFEDEKDASAEVQRAQHERGQDDLSTLSTNSRWIMANQSGHHVHLREADLIVELIRQVVDAVRSRKALCCQR